MCLLGKLSLQTINIRVLKEVYDFLEIQDRYTELDFTSNEKKELLKVNEWYHLQLENSFISKVKCKTSQSSGAI